VAALVSMVVDRKSTRGRAERTAGAHRIGRFIDAAVPCGAKNLPLRGEIQIAFAVEHNALNRTGSIQYGNRRRVGAAGPSALQYLGAGAVSEKEIQRSINSYRRRTAGRVTGNRDRGAVYTAIPGNFDDAMVAGVRYVQILLPSTATYAGLTSDVPEKTVTGAP